MAIQDSKTVALERRGDLTSLLCMIGRYGPAVALAAITMLGVWAVSFIYRTVRSRKQMSDNNMPTAEKDAVNPPGVTPKGDAIASSEESTEETDEGLPEMLGSKSEAPMEDLQGTNENSDLSEEESDADWLPIEECHPGSPPEHHCETSEQCLSYGQADQEEPASGKMNENGHLTGMDMHSQTEQRLEEVGLSDEGTGGEEPEINHPHAFDEDLHKGLEHPGDGNLPEVMLGDTDLEEPQTYQVCEEQEIEIYSCEETSEKTCETDTGAIVKDPFPQADNEYSARVGYIEYYDVSDACWLKNEECVDDPITCRQAENWSEVMIGLQGPLVDQTQLKEQQESCLEEDDSQDALHHSVIDQLSELVEDSESNLIDRSNAQPSELLKERDCSGIDPQSDQMETRVAGMIDQLMDPTEVRNPIVIPEMKGESADKNIDTGTEESYEKTEISIMEATMDNNEWMTVGTTDSHIRDLPWLTLTNLSSAALFKIQQRPEDDQQDLSNVTAKDTAGPLTGEQSNEAVMAVQPLPPTVRVSFRVHYLTPSPCQVLAVTGNQQVLGCWKSFVLLEGTQDGFWASSVSLPAESQVEWKFVLVEEGRIQRWEECSNRRLETGHHGEDLHLHEWWGYL